MKRKGLYLGSFLIGLILSTFLLFNNNKEDYYNVSNFLEIKYHEDSLMNSGEMSIGSMPLEIFYDFIGNKDSVAKHFQPLGFRYGIDSILKPWNENYEFVILNSDTNNLKFLGKTKQLDTWIKQIDNYKLYNYYNVDFDSVYAKNIREYNNWGVK